MPLAGPRPNPNPAKLSAYDPPTSSMDEPGPAFPSSPPSSQRPFPHESSPESGTTVLEPLRSNQHDGYTSAEHLQHQWSIQNRPLPRQEADLADEKQRYNEPYDPPMSALGSNHPYEEEQDRMRQDPSSPSLGPWDSASQRSAAPSLMAFPLPQPVTQPLASGRRDKVRNKPSMGGLSYIDEEGAYYRSDSARPASEMALSRVDDVEMRGLVDDAGAFGGREGEGYTPNLKSAEFEESPWPYPPNPKSPSLQQPGRLYSMLLFPTGLDRLLALFGVKQGIEPVEQQIERKKRGIGGQRWPVAAWTLTVVMTALLVYEIVRNNQLTGSPIAIHPSFNYMIGPSSEVLVNIGARFPPCMKYIDDIPPDYAIACLNNTSSNPTSSCTIEEICGHGGFHGQDPNQSWRFVLPIFLHVGVIHLLFNMAAQVTIGAQIEREMGTIPFLMTYLAGGIYGFVLGGCFNRPGIPSVGASGALFAINACVSVDLGLHWKYEPRPKLKAFLLLVEFCIGIAIGYIPNAVDGLAHLGGFAVGLLMGIILYPSISETKRHRYIVWGLRIAAIPLLIVAFVLTVKNFYTDDPNKACEWCKYLSCIPTSSNDRCTGTGLTTTSSSSTRRSWDLL